jgi:hypothetical protein
MLDDEREKVEWQNERAVLAKCKSARSALVESDIYKDLAVMWDRGISLTNVTPV